MNILVLHGPNLNLIGLNSKIPDCITMDKINKSIRKSANNYNIKLKILQTHSESRAVTFLQRNRKITAGLLFFPGAWNQCGYIIKDTISLLKIEHIHIYFSDEPIDTIFDTNFLLSNNYPIDAYNKGLKKLIKNIRSNDSKI